MEIQRSGSKPSGKGPAEFFTDTNFGGDHLWLGAGRQFTDLTRVGRGDFWNRHTWNDCISSIKPVPYLGWLVLCWDTNLGGSTLTITITGDSGGANPLNGKDIPSLVPFGWNDQCSSIVYWSDGTTRG